MSRGGTTHVLDPGRIPDTSFAELLAVDVTEQEREDRDHECKDNHHDTDLGQRAQDRFDDALKLTYGLHVTHDSQAANGFKQACEAKNPQPACAFGDKEQGCGGFESDDEVQYGSL